MFLFLGIFLGIELLSFIIILSFVLERSYKFSGRCSIFYCYYEEGRVLE